MKLLNERKFDGLVKRGTWTVVSRKVVPKGSNILNGRFLLAVKNKGTEDEAYKARFVVQGHRDREKNLLVHNSPNIRQSSVRTLVSVAAINGFDIWSHDVSQAYLQSTEDLARHIYLVPSKESALPPDGFL